MIPRSFVKLDLLKTLAQLVWATLSTLITFFDIFWLWRHTHTHTLPLNFFFELFVQNSDGGGSLYTDCVHMLVSRVCVSVYLCVWIHVFTMTLCTCVERGVAEEGGG